LILRATNTVQSVRTTIRDISSFGWNKDRAPIESFILFSAANIREIGDYDEQ
ncbi:hypothetical protein KI387_035962, partial [Taxus chinensis]